MAKTSKTIVKPAQAASAEQLPVAIVKNGAKPLADSTREVLAGLTEEDKADAQALLDHINDEDRNAEARERLRASLAKIDAESKKPKGHLDLLGNPVKPSPFFPSQRKGIL